MIRRVEPRDCEPVDHYDEDGRLLYRIPRGWRSFPVTKEFANEWRNRRYAQDADGDT